MILKDIRQPWTGMVDKPGQQEDSQDFFVITSFKTKLKVSVEDRSHNVILQQNQK